MNEIQKKKLNKTIFILFLLLFIVLLKPFNLEAMYLLDWPDHCDYVEIGDNDYNCEIKVVGASSPYTFNIIDGEMPYGFIFDNKKGIISSSLENITDDISILGNWSFDIEVTDSKNLTAQMNYNITIYPELNILTKQIKKSGVINENYYCEIQIEGGKSTYSITIDDGVLPDNMSLYSGSNYAVLSGIPEDKGEYNFSIKVIDSLGYSTINQYSISVIDKLIIKNEFLHDGIIENEYCNDLIVENAVGSYTFNISYGNLPDGLNLDNKNSRIFGIPKNKVEYCDIVIEVIDEDGNNAYKEYKGIDCIRVSEKIVIENDDIYGTINSEISEPVNIKGGIKPYYYWITGYTNGINFNSESGYFYGTPEYYGSYNITLNIQDSSKPFKQYAQKNIELIIEKEYRILNDSIFYDSIKDKDQVQILLVVNGGISPYKWSKIDGIFPNGIELKESGLISGTPKESGHFAFIIQVTDSNNLKIEKMFIWQVKEELQITNQNIPIAVVDRPFNFQLEAKGGLKPYLWSIENLPDGLSYDKSSGLIYGTPKNIFNQEIYVKLEDSDSKTISVSKSINFIVNKSELSLEPDNLEYGKINYWYCENLNIIKGNMPYKWKIVNGYLPPGLDIDSYQNILEIKGRPNKSGDFPFSIEITDSSTPEVKIYKDFSISIINPVKIMNINLKDAMHNQDYLETIYLSGGTSPFTFTALDTLPNGLNLDSSTGIINGKPDIKNDSIQFRIQVQDSGKIQSLDIKTFSIYVFEKINVNILTDTLLDISQYKQYSDTITVEGGKKPYKWNILNGKLPDGLNGIVNNNNFIIKGIPEICGKHNFTLEITDYNNSTNLKSFSLDVKCNCDYEISGNVSGQKDVYLGIYDFNNNEKIMETTSDISGNYTFSNIGCGEYFVIPEMQAYTFSCDYNFPIINKNEKNLNFLARFSPDNNFERKKSKAVIITSFEHISKFEDESWPLMQSKSNYVYTILGECSYYKDNILFIHDSNCLSKYENLGIKEKLIETIKEFSSDAKKLIIYMAGYGENNKFWITENEYIDRNFLLEFDDDICITLIYDGFESKTFINNDLYGHNKCYNIITNSAKNRIDQFNDDFSYFSNFFWTSIKNGSDIKAALQNTFDNINDLQSLKDKFTQNIDVNSNAVSNEEEDFSLLAGLKIDGRDMVEPEIVEVSKDQTIEKSPFATIWAKVEPGSGNIRKVWAEISKIETKKTNDEPYPVIELIQNNAIFENTYKFDETGKYEIKIYCQNSEGLFALPKNMYITREKILKAIIIAGTQKNINRDFLWDGINFNANFSRKALIYNNYLNENIKVFAPDLYDEFNNKISYVTDISTVEAIGNAITNWASDADKLIIYMVDHGTEDFFYATKQESITPYHLTKWLNFSSKIINEIVLIYDACKSGDFLSKIKFENFSDLNNKIYLISSTSPGEDASFQADGGLSFSFHLWSYISTGEKTIKEAFYNTKFHLAAYIGINQRPQINSNLNDIWNEDDDLYMLNDCFIGSSSLKNNGYISESIKKSLNGESVNKLSITKNEFNVKDFGNIEKVYTIIIPPGGDYLPNANPSTDYMRLELIFNDINNYYEGTFRHFNIMGEYDIYYWAINENNEIILIKSETIIQNNEIIYDEYEPDNNYYMANYIDKAQNHNFCLDNSLDIDWFFFYGKADSNYSISLTNMEENCIPDINVFDSHINQIEYNLYTDTINKNTVFVDFSGKNQMYYIKVSNKNNKQLKTGYVINLIKKDTSSIIYDAYENDDILKNARMITINDENKQRHFFHDKDDEDWVKFYGIKNKNYTIKARPIGENCRLMLKLYDKNGNPVQNKKQNKSLRNEQIYWICNKSDIYYVNIYQIEIVSDYGKNTEYDLEVYIPVGNDYLGSVYGNIRNIITNEVIDEVLLDGEYLIEEASKKNGFYHTKCTAGDVRYLFVSKKYYERKEVPFPCIENGNTNIDIKLMPRPSIELALIIMKKLSEMENKKSIPDEQINIKTLIDILKKLTKMQI